MKPIKVGKKPDISGFIRPFPIKSRQKQKVEFIYLSELSDRNKREIFELWNNEYPEKLMFKTIVEFENFLNSVTEHSHILMIDNKQQIKGWCFNFVREKEKWFSIIIDSDLQREGFGSRILKLAKKNEVELNGWVIDHNKDKRRNGTMYKSPLNFYLKNGFEQLPEFRYESNQISAVKIKWKE